MTWQGPYRDGLVHVAAERCSTCVFRPGNLMSLSPGRLADLVHDNLAVDSALTCHKTLAYGGHGLDGAVCRGFLDAYADQALPLRVARALDCIQEVPVP